MKLSVLLFAFFATNVVAYEVGTDDANCGQTPIPPKLDEEDRIFGGSVAVPGSWPWHAGIFTNELFPKHICSGALISDRHVITAAHCLLKKTSKMLRIHLGAHDRGSVEAEAVSVAVDEVCFHKEYKPPHTNDIAILTLKEAVNFTKTIGPVCLPKAMHELPENTDAYVTGWGRHKAGSDELAPQLKQLRTRTMWHKTCILDYDAPVPESVLCTGHDFGSSCKGDSGGPLVWNSGSAWTLEGVVSGGPVKCANPDDPLLFTKVSHQIDTFIMPYLRAKDVAQKHQICKIL